MSRKFLGFLAAVFLGIGLLSGTLYFIAASNPQGSTTQTAIGGPFTLTGTDGKLFSSETLKGKPYVVFFGFTHCPEICPTTLFDLTQDIKELGSDADKFNVVFITVDPERDTPELIKLYLSSFDDRIIGLTGSEKEIAAVARNFKAFYKKTPTSDGGYTMDHQVTIFMMDNRGRFVGATNYQETQEIRLAKIRRLISGG